MTKIMWAPNLISLSRAAASVGLLFPAVFSTPFWTIYIWCGISDMIDGPLARRFGAESKVGAAIDSTADLIFVVCACVRIVPALAVPGWLWLIIGIAAALQTIRMCFLYFRRGGWDALHDRANKLVGLLLYLMPFAVAFAGIRG